MHAIAAGGDVVKDYSGGSVDLSSDGTRVAIGATGNDGAGSNAGHVRVYDWNGTTWTQVGADIDGETADDALGYSVPLSSDGSRIAVDAPGYVRVYEYGDGSWTPVGAALDAGSAFGPVGRRRVALSSDGSRLAIGKPCGGGYGICAGYVGIYDYDAGSWSQLGHDIVGPFLQHDSYFGVTVALSDNGSIVAAAALSDDTGGYKGHVGIYEYVNSGWSQLGATIDGKKNSDGSEFISLALSSDGTRVAFGASSAPFPEDYGTVRVFDYAITSTAECGDGTIDTGEQCDGTAFGGATCESLDFDGGTLSCSACALQYAASLGRPVIPLFVWAPSENERWPLNERQKWWLRRSLVSLSDSLSDLGSALIIRNGPSLEALLDIARETMAKTVVWNRCYEPFQTKLDVRIESSLGKEDIETYFFNGMLLYEPGSIRTRVGVHSGGLRRIGGRVWLRLPLVNLYRHPQT